MVIGSTVTAKVTPSEVVSKNEDHVGTRSRWTCQRCCCWRFACC